MRSSPRFHAPACALFLALLLGCDAGIVTAPPLGASYPGPDGGPGSPEDPAPGADPRETFETTVLSALTAECGACHADDRQGVGFLEGPDPYAQALAWPGLVVPGDPASSELVTKGRHTGPPLSAASQRAAIAWIELEGAGEAPGTPGDPTPGDPGSGGNAQPTAAFTLVTSESDPLRVTFDASPSDDRDGTIVSWSWSFGDGQTGGGPAIEHVYDRTGTYAVQLTVTDDAGGRGLATQVITVGEEGSRIVRLVLIDADADAEIPTHTPLVSGAVLDLAALPTTNLSVRADTSPSEVGSLRWTLDGVDIQTENNLPYAIAGDSGPGDYQPWTPEPGTHTLTATPYSEPDGGGLPGTPLTIEITVL